MFKAEVNQTLSWLSEIFRRMCIWSDEEGTVIRKSCIRTLHFFQYFTFLIYALCGVHQALVMGDNNQMIFMVEVEIALAVIFTKLAFLLWRKDEILRFLYDPVVTHCTANCDELVVANDRIEKIALLIKVYVRFVFVSMCFCVLAPLGAIANEEKMLPFFIYFKVESNYDMVLYVLAFVYASVNCMLCAVFTSIMTFIWYIMCNFSIEYKLLGHRVRLLLTTTPSTYQQEFIHLIRAHSNLFNTVEQFRSCFTALFLVEIFTAALSICMSTYNLSYNTPESVLETVIYVAGLLYAFCEIFVSMYLANEIIIESDRLSYCLFESNWIDQSKSARQAIIIFGEIIKKPQEMVIFIYPMNLERFTSIVNGAYSLFNILKNYK